MVYFWLSAASFTGDGVIVFITSGAERQHACTLDLKGGGGGAAGRILIFAAIIHNNCVGAEPP